MTIRDMKGIVEDRIPVNTVLISVFDKTGLEQFVPELVDINPAIEFFSTGGTYSKIKDILGIGYFNNLSKVEDYTQFPEMEGGLVKTLHPKIHAGILGERNNPAHQQYLKETLNDAKYIDMVVVNLYPFEKVISSPDVTFEKARGNIDIGGPTMIRAAAKNFPSCAVICDPSDYKTVLNNIKENNGATTFDERARLALQVFATTAEYDYAIATYFAKELNKGLPEIRKNYQFNKGEQNGQRN
jgi:phosphoribosylaminoimidazolecarboxamide formyltransferase / IMP cyclohydrolase